MSELVPQCDNFDAEICWRYASTAESKCLRCGHIEVCHVALAASSPAHVCFFRRDDKTVETCRGKFDNWDRFKNTPAFPPEPPHPVSEPDPSDEYDHYREKHGNAIIEYATPRQLMRNDRLSPQIFAPFGCGAGHSLVDHERNDNCAMLGCYPVPSAPECPSYEERLNQIAGTEGVAPLREFNQKPNDDLISSLIDGIFNAKPGVVTETVPSESPKFTLANLNVARMRHELYDAIRRYEKEDSLEGFHLARVWVRLGEWARLTGDVCRYKNENPPKMGPAQVGSMWIDTLSANIPICENPFIAEKIIVRPDPAKSTAMQMAEAENSPRRVICVLEYEREREGAYRWWIQLPARETLLRILTE